MQIASFVLVGVRVTVCGGMIDASFGRLAKTRCKQVTKSVIRRQHVASCRATVNMGIMGLASSKNALSHVVSARCRLLATFVIMDSVMVRVLAIRKMIGNAQTPRADIIAGMVVPAELGQ